MFDAQPSKPKTSTPPQGLLRLKKRALTLPSVARAGLTTTKDGEWALKVWLKEETPESTAQIEKMSKDYPVVYDKEPAYPPVARPAYPDLGE